MRPTTKGFIVLGVIGFLFLTISKIATANGQKIGDVFKANWQKPKKK